MSGCNKYHVVQMNKVVSPEELEKWINQYCEMGEDLVAAIAVDGNYFIFAKHAYIKSIKRIEETINESDGENRS